ncbi:mechanosensitive ion channel, partial [bacterium]|nr:mechanosensitive ion channel [bacterium]
MSQFLRRLALVAFLFCGYQSSFAQIEERTSVKKVSDGEIQDRASKLLSATEWFSDVQVEVSEGLVFLRGGSPSPEKSEWAVNVIGKLDGVVEVIDNTETLGRSDQILEPAFEEGRLIVHRAYKMLPYLASSFVIIIFFGVLAFVTRKTSFSLIRKRKGSVLVAQAITNVISLSIVLVGLYFALRSSGLSGLAFTVLGGTGMIGIGVGLALKSSFENYASGIMISVRDLFRKGEIVQINGVEGFVQAVTSRGTSLMDYEGNHITIPNSEVFKSTIKNFTRNPNMRADFTIGIGYDDSIDEAKEVIARTLKRLSNLLLKDPEFLITVEGLGAATVNLRVYFWFNAVKYSKLKIRSHVIQKTKEALMRAKISMPDDAREVVFKSPLQIIQKEFDERKKEVREVEAPVKKYQDLEEGNFGYESSAENIDLENE